MTNLDLMLVTALLLPVSAVAADSLELHGRIDPELELRVDAGYVATRDSALCLDYKLFGNPTPKRKTISFAARSGRDGGYELRATIQSDAWGFCGFRLESSMLLVLARGNPAIEYSVIGLEHVFDRQVLGFLSLGSTGNDVPLSGIGAVSATRPNGPGMPLWLEPVPANDPPVLQGGRVSKHLDVVRSWSD
jgi:hypothetical protein